MKNIPKGLCVLLLIIQVIHSSVCAASTYASGIKSGDWIKHEVVFSGSSSAKLWTIITVESVDGTVMNGTYETVIGAGVHTNETFSYDISTGRDPFHEDNLIVGYVIPANLTVGQAIPGESMTVQEVVDWHGRKAVRANATSLTPFLSGYHSQVYWDQITGVVLEASGRSGPDENFRITITDTNLWHIESSAGLELVLWSSVIIIVGVVVAATALVLRRKKKSAAKVAPRHSQPSSKRPSPTKRQRMKDPSSNIQSETLLETLLRILGCESEFISRIECRFSCVLLPGHHHSQPF